MAVNSAKKREMNVSLGAASPNITVIYVSQCKKPQLSNKSLCCLQ